MKTPALCSIALAASVLALYPQTDVTLSVSQQRADFDVLRAALEEAHGGFDRFASRGDVERRFLQHRTQLDHAMTRIEFSGIIAEAIAEVRDGHARLELDSASAASFAEAKVFPLRVMFEGDRLMIIGNDAEGDASVRPGMELLEINGRRVTDIVASLLSKISPDGFIETGRKRALARNFARHYWLYGERAEQYRLKARGNSDRILVATLPAVAQQPPMITPGANITVKFANDRIPIMQIRSFGEASFSAELDSVFRIVRERDAKSLILDLRGNGGGVDEYGALLVSHFVDHPFRYFDRIHLTTIAPSFATWLPKTFASTKEGTVLDSSGSGFLVTPAMHSGVAEQKADVHSFAGKLIVLIDGGSFSTTADVAAQLRSMNRATFIGEETGGVYEGNTSGLNAQVTLPNSRLRLKIMMYGYGNAVRPAAQYGRGTIPDFPIFPRAADVIDGRDPVLARALAVATF